jgi:cyclohexyl-isocyanide hydratase
MAGDFASTDAGRAPGVSVGLVLFPRLTQLDLTGPYEVFSRLPGAVVHLIAETRAPVVSERGLAILPTTTFEDAPPLDILCVPGGPGVNPMMEDEAMLAFLAAQGRQARYVTSVCTGALLLGAAGLLRGYRATTHWLSLELLTLFGAHAVEERVVIDRNRITGGGVTAGIDFSLVVAAELFGAATAQEVQLMIEYDPAPPFAGGTPRHARRDIVDAVIRSRHAIQAERRRIAERVAARLSQSSDG